MPAREIAREQWQEFLEGFSVEHQGCPATIEVRDSGADQSRETRDLPLAGVSAEQKGSAAPAVEILIGADPKDHLTHRVEDPTHIRFIEAEGGNGEGLEIDSQEEGLTTLRVHCPRAAGARHGVADRF